MTSNSSGIIIREATDQDAPVIERLVTEAGMGTLTPRGRSFMAERDGRIAGFIRIVEAEGNPYVNPIIVDAHARRSGIGRALMESAHARFGELLFVARGHAVPFYEALGCERVPWDRISPDLGEDCDSCPDLTTCAPVPMIYR